VSYRDWLLDQVTSIWGGFEQTFLKLWRDHESRRKSHFMGDDPGGVCAEAYRARFMQQLLAQSLGFAGCKMIRRIVGMAKVADITSIADNASRAAIEVRALRCAERLLVERHAIGNIAQVVSIARELQADGHASP
jgi:5-methylthioribose kinase